ELLRERKFDEVDWEHLIEEVEGLAGSDRRAIRSQLLRLLMHLIKERIQPERAGTSWRTSIVNAQQEIGLILEDSPSLKRYLESALQKTYRTAERRLARNPTYRKAEEFHLPHNCPFTVPQLLKDDPNTLRGMLK
ncbi:MAG: DUF29 domain-containing protein, partial [Acidobacteriia bacterium]|nr:DUF29 domain-containing protein [Terriglobia bacterium]